MYYVIAEYDNDSYRLIWRVWEAGSDDPKINVWALDRAYLYRHWAERAAAVENRANLY